MLLNIAKFIKTKNLKQFTCISKKKESKYWLWKKKMFATVYVFMVFPSIYGILASSNILTVENSTTFSKSPDNYIIFIKPRKSGNINLEMSYNSEQFQR